MIYSSRCDSKTKAIAEVLAMIADAHPEFAPHHPRPVCETEEWLWENATEFCAALDRYAGALDKRRKKKSREKQAARKGGQLGFSKPARDNHELPAAAVPMIPLAILLTLFGIFAAELYWITH